MFVLSIFGFLTLSIIINFCCNKTKNKDKTTTKTLIKQASRSKLAPAPPVQQKSAILKSKVKEIVPTHNINNNNNNNNDGGDQKIGEKNKLEIKKSCTNGARKTEEDGPKTNLRNGGDLTMEDTIVWLKPDGLPKLDKTLSDDQFSPAVHERANRIAADKLILDPKHTTYGGNIDQLPEKERQAKLTKFQEELENNKNVTDSRELSNKLNSNEMRVKVREDKCVMFETNEVPTDDEEDEQKPEEFP